MNDQIIINAVISVITSGTVIVILREQIKSQKAVIESMKSYMDLFKIDELKKYVEVIQARAQKEKEELASEVQKLQKVEDDLKKSVQISNELVEQSKMQLVKYNQLLQGSNEEMLEYVKGLNIAQEIAPMYLHENTMLRVENEALKKPLQK